MKNTRVEITNNPINSLQYFNFMCSKEQHYEGTGVHNSDYLII